LLLNGGEKIETIGLPLRDRFRWQRGYGEFLWRI